jgi:uncharacterized protein YjbI with pentapeptide repeats
MKRVKLVVADLRNASMLHTNFTGSDLRGALLSDQALKRAVLLEALFDEEELDEPATADPTVNDAA